MKKIIIPGAKPKKYKLIFRVGCEQCGCIFECDKRDFDFVREYEGKLIDGTIKCPCCKTELNKCFATIPTRIEEEN